MPAQATTTSPVATVDVLLDELDTLLTSLPGRGTAHFDIRRTIGNYEATAYMNGSSKHPAAKNLTAAGKDRFHYVTEIDADLARALDRLIMRVRLIHDQEN